MKGRSYLVVVFFKSTELYERGLWNKSWEIYQKENYFWVTGEIFKGLEVREYGGMINGSSGGLLGEVVIILMVDVEEELIECFRLIFEFLEYVKF